jgi:hypothetical protein
MFKLIQRILGPRPNGASEWKDDEAEGAHHPARAPAGSQWAAQDDVDFFVNPALTMDAISYLSTNGTGPEDALRERFGLPPRQVEAAEKEPEAQGESSSSSPKQK